MWVRHIVCKSHSTGKHDLHSPRSGYTEKHTMYHWLHSSARLSYLCGHFWIYHKVWSLWQARSTFPAFAKLELQQGNFGKQKWNARQPLAQWLIVRTGRHHVTSINISVYWICTWNILSNLATVSPPKSSLPLVFLMFFFSSICQLKGLLHRGTPGIPNH